MKQSVTVAHRRSKDIQNWRSSDFADFFKLVGVSICVKKKEDLRQRYELVVSFLKYLASGESLEEPTEGFDDLDRRDPDSPPPLKRELCNLCARPKTGHICKTALHQFWAVENNQAELCDPLQTSSSCARVLKIYGNIRVPKHYGTWTSLRKFKLERRPGARIG